MPTLPLEQSCPTWEPVSLMSFLIEPEEGLLTGA